jgi:hypothetical protein
MKKNQTYKNLSFAFGAGAIIIVFSFLFYTFHFGFKVSVNHAIWGQFGDFMSVFISIANLIIISSLTYFIAKIEEKRDQENRNLELSKVRPILIFKDIGMKWACRNVGEGAALNVMIAYKTNLAHDWENPVKIYSLTSNEEFKIEWKKFHIAKWVAVYYDIYGTVFSSTCEHDDTIYQAEINELLAFINHYKRLEDVKNVSFD